MADAKIDMNRESTGVVLPPDVSDEVWQRTQEQSAVMGLANRTAMPGEGRTFQIITSDPEPSWVDETNEIAVASGAVSSKTVKAYKMALIEPFSNEFRRDKAALYDAIANRMPGLVAKKFDSTVFGFSTKPGEYFDTLSGVTSVDVETDVWAGIVTAEDAVATTDGNLNGWALSPKGRALVKTAVDANKRPLFVNDLQAGSQVATLDGSPARVYRAVGDSTATPVVYGFAGDWTDAFYGVVRDITIDISEQATLTTDTGTINLWQQDMFALRLRFEAGFYYRFADKFVKLVGKATA